MSYLECKPRYWRFLSIFFYTLLITKIHINMYLLLLLFFLSYKTVNELKRKITIIYFTLYSLHFVNNLLF